MSQIEHLCLSYRDIQQGKKGRQWCMSSIKDCFTKAFQAHFLGLFLSILRSHCLREVYVDTEGEGQHLLSNRRHSHH